MAKYTMLFAEYLEKGGALPSSFALIDGFESAFIGHFCDKEIGFETPALFSIKLEAKANLVMQTYAEKIDEKARYWSKLENPSKTYYESGNTNYLMGKQKVKTTELPLNSLSAEPNIINENDAYENEDARVVNKEEKGANIDDIIKMLDYLNKDVTTLVERCLNEFKTLFMQVY